MNLGSPDASTATEFLNDLLNASSALWLDQFARWSSVFQQMQQGKYTFSQWQRDFTSMWDPLFAMATFPMQWWTQFSRAVPTMLFIVDEAAETVGPFQAPTNISIPAGLTPEISELHQIGGNAVLNKEHVSVRFIPDANRVEVSLVDLGCSPDDRKDKKIEPGFFAGPVYVKELSARRPLAIVCVFIEPPTRP